MIEGRILFEIIDESVEGLLLSNEVGPSNTFITISLDFKVSYFFELVLKKCLWLQKGTMQQKMLMNLFLTAKIIEPSGKSFKT